jgi:hypothetical protein
MLTVEVKLPEKVEPKWISLKDTPTGFFVADSVKWFNSYGELRTGGEKNGLYSHRGDSVTIYTNEGMVLGHYTTSDALNTSFLNVRVPKNVSIKVEL